MPPQKQKARKSRERALSRLGDINSFLLQSIINCPKVCFITIIIDQEAEQSVKLMIDSVAAAELDNVRKRQKEVVQV